ncbi:spore photoproduct lyase [Desulfocucumis palustris]|uniref:Spore photoproduct lyase n=1 Tax=Desulfocucumis palustris TaxID=1898651 RepID=A0A2L2X833_9FIRM|nr:spore photoproduct lyase [Desulfocucumis palustris]
MSLGKCEYCYLQTTLGNKPYVRVYVRFSYMGGKLGEFSRQ